MLGRLAPLLFVLLWSSSFIAAKAGLRHMSPLLFVAVRARGPV
jgi:drug/metabolite transporter (DMT)-like permease